MHDINIEDKDPEVNPEKEEKKMGDMCVSLDNVKKGFLPMVKAVDVTRKKDGKVCRSEMPGVSREDFKAFVNIVRISPSARVAQIKIPEMAQIPAGRFKMGSTKYKNEGPVRKVKISKPFKIGKYEVTNKEYKVFLEATGQKVPKLAADPTQARHPVVKVSWHDAAAYCKWLSKTTGRKFRLPTEAEREYAARGTDGRKYPWGNKWDASKVTFDTRGTRPVNAHPNGASPFGVMDMSGNVWEWTADWYADKYNPKDLVDPKGPKKGTSRVLRGGSGFSINPDFLRSANRSNGHPGDRSGNIGFRVSEDLK